MIAGMGAGSDRRAYGRRAAALALALLLAGCATLERQGELPQQPAAPPAAPRTVGVDALTTAEHKKLVAQFGGEYRWPAAESYLNAILVRLAAASDVPTTPYRVTILNTPVVNAFALPSGNLYISRGLLALANDSSEVAAVMGCKWWFARCWGTLLVEFASESKLLVRKRIIRGLGSH